MARTRRSASEESVLDQPIATIAFLIVLVAVSIVFVVNGGHLSDDAERFFAIVMGGTGLVAVGRGFAARKPG